MAATATMPSQSRPHASSQQSQRLRLIHSRHIAFMPNASFSSDDDQIDWLGNPRLKAVEEEDAVQQSPDINGLPGHLMRMCETPIMTADEERAFFRRMNYLKFQANALRDNFDDTNASTKQLDQIENLLEKVERIRNYIVQANVRLVMSIAKKFADVNNVFDDMLSEGIMSLMRSGRKIRLRPWLSLQHLRHNVHPARSLPTGHEN